MTYMGFDQTNFIKLHDMVWIYKNFLSLDECQDTIEKIENGEFHSVTPNGANQIKFNSNFIREKINLIINDKNTFQGSISSYNTPAGVFWKAHTDLSGPTDQKYEKQSGIVGYLNKFDGGELLFPDYGIVIKPEPGDLLIHHASCYHSVALTKSEKRLTYTSELVKLKDELSAVDRENAVAFLVNQKYNK